MSFPLSDKVSVEMCQLYSATYRIDYGIIIIGCTGLYFSTNLLATLHSTEMLNMMINIQCWASYFLQVTSYILHITCN